MTMTHAHEARTPSRVVILGASGFIGTGMLEVCRGQGIETVGLSSRELDLTRPEAGQRLIEWLRPQDTLVFLSAITPDKCRNVSALFDNLAMGRAVHGALQIVRPAHLVYASSDAVYSFGAEPITEETPASPIDLYGAMHRTREIMLAELGVPMAVLRYTAVYGNGDTHNSYGPNRFLREALKDGRINLFGNGEELRDHIYIDDAVDMTMGAILRGSVGLLNVVTGLSMPFRRVADIVGECAGKALPIPSVRKNPVTHRCFDNTSVRRAFPEMKFTRLSDGLKKMTANDIAAAA